MERIAVCCPQSGGERSISPAALSAARICRFVSLGANILHSTESA